jgi:hypothetical protein
MKVIHPKMSTNTIPSSTSMEEKEALIGKITLSSHRVQTGLGLTLLGMCLFTLGARPGFFGLDRSPVVGFVQITVFEIGLAIICAGGYISLGAFWRYRKSTVLSGFGARFIITGFVIAFFAGMADIIGIGSHRLPLLFYGPLQTLGVLLGQGLSAFGFLMLIPLSSNPPNGKSPKPTLKKSS